MSVSCTPLGPACERLAHRREPGQVEVGRHRRHRCPATRARPPVASGSARLAGAGLGTRSVKQPDPGRRNERSRMPVIGSGDGRISCWRAPVVRLTGAMTWDDGSAYLQELAPGVYAYVQPDGGWMVNNCGVITDGSGDAVLVDTTSTEKRNRALLAEVAGVAARDPKIAVNTHHHPDHTYGNGFLPATTTIIGHHLCREGVLRARLKATARAAGRLRRPRRAPAGRDRRQRRDAAPGRVPGRAARSWARPTRPTTSACGCPSRR